MLDGVSLDHLRMFIAAADEGSFSVADAGCEERDPSSAKRLRIWRPSSLRLDDGPSCVIQGGVY
jgi:hypothetical protein